MIINTINCNLPGASQTGQMSTALFELLASIFIPIILHILTTFQIFIDVIESKSYQSKPKQDKQQIIYQDIIGRFIK